METVIQTFRDLMQEIYTGTDGQHTWIIDNTPGNNLRSALKKVTAEDASTPTHRGGTTIAAHTGHLKWSLDYAMEFYKGQQPSWNWDDSWKRNTVNEDEWTELQAELSAAYHRVITAIAGVSDWSNPALIKGTLALLPHASYHLGAIKQLILAVTHHEKAAIGLQ